MIMEGTLTIPVVTQATETASHVTNALNGNDRFTIGTVCPDLQQLVSSMGHPRPRAVLVDIDSSPREIFIELGDLTRQFHETSFIALSDSLQGELVLEAMQVGVRDFVQKGSIRSNLTGVLERLILNGDGGGSVQHGEVIVLLSASGGCGSTTVAVNLANELQQLAGEPALLIDMDPCYGGVATYLGLEGRFGLTDILARQGEIDGPLVQSTAQNYNEDLHVLLSPAAINMASPQPIDPSRMGEMIDAARHAYRYVVIDAPRIPVATAQPVIAASDSAMIVLQLTVKDIASAKAIMSALQSLGVMPSAITPLVNRYKKRGSMITLAEAGKALGYKSLRCLRNDYRGAIRGLNLGQPLAEAAARSTLRCDMRILANHVAATLKQQSAAGSRVI